MEQEVAKQIHRGFEEVVDKLLQSNIQEIFFQNYPSYG